MRKLISFSAICLTLLFPFMSLAAGKVENISNEKLMELMESGVALVDIRTEPEWNETGIIEGSHTLTLFDESGRAKADFLPRLQKIADADTPVIVICRTGNRTTAASRALTQQIGYEKVYNVTYGIKGWIAKGHPVSKYTR